MENFDAKHVNFVKTDRVLPQFLSSLVSVFYFVVCALKITPTILDNFNGLFNT